MSSRYEGALVAGRTFSVCDLIFDLRSSGQMGAGYTAISRSVMKQRSVLPFRKTLHSLVCGDPVVADLDQVPLVRINAVDQNRGRIGVALWIGSTAGT